MRPTRSLPFRGAAQAALAKSTLSTGRQSWPLALVLAMLTCSVRLDASPLMVDKRENLLKYAQAALHGPLPGGVDTHVVTPLPATYWSSPFTVTGRSGPVADTLTATHTAQHLAAPHLLESTPGPQWSPPGLAPAPALFGISPASSTAMLDHGHIDRFDCGLVVFYAVGKAAGYAFTSHGLHDPVRCASREGPIGGDQCVPPSGSQAFGSVSLGIDMSDQSIALAVAARGIARFDLLSAAIHVGPPGSNGPMIFDLGPGSMWDDLGGLGIARITVEEHFPPSYLQDLLAGNTYVELRTVAYPAGEIRGQLVAPPSVIGDTGAPNKVLFSSQPMYVGLSSGSAPGMPQRWAAVPFSIPPAGAVVSRIDADWFVSPGYEAETVNYIIWQRTGLTAPLAGDERAAGVLGPYGPGLDDPRTPHSDDWLHKYDMGLPLPGGDYYFTLYAAGLGAGNTSGFSDAPWLTGGDLQRESLEQPFLWRSTSFPAPGFEPYASPTIQPVPGQDPDDCWNPSFSIYGHVNHLLGVTVLGSGSVIKSPELPGYPSGTPVTLMAVPQPGAVFVGWSGDANGAVNPLPLTMLNDMSITATFAGSTGVEAEVPTTLALGPVRPTPTAGPAWIDFALPSESPIRLSIFDVHGRQVVRLAEGVRGPGRHHLWWNGRAANGPVPAGVYVVRLEVAGQSLLRRLVVTR